MTLNPADDLEKLFACLVRAVRDQRPEQLARGLDVSALLALVPYKGVRAEVGAATHDDYGHVVMRLLAGERGLLVADDLMQDTLTGELESKNPNLQAYRTYLNTHVTLAPERVHAVLGSLGPAAVPAPAVPLAPAIPVAPAVPLAPAVPNTPAPASVSVPLRAGRPNCEDCGQPLPVGRDVRFCPHCGQNRSMLRCSACSTAFEPGWKFCVTCGHAVTF